MLTCECLGFFSAYKTKAWIDIVLCCVERRFSGPHSSVKFCCCARLMVFLCAGRCFACMRSAEVFVPLALGRRVSARGLLTWTATTAADHHQLSSSVAAPAADACFRRPATWCGVTAAQIGAQSRLMSSGLRKLCASASKSNTTLIFINQLRYKVTPGCLPFRMCFIWKSFCPSPCFRCRVRLPGGRFVAPWDALFTDGYSCAVSSEQVGVLYRNLRALFHRRRVCDNIYLLFFLSST